MTRDFESGKQLQLLKGDITKIPVDAIVNAANSALAGGGGVDGAIHAAAGPALRIELDDIIKKQGGCETGSAVSTTGGTLPAKYVFHAVGPIYKDGKSGEPELLRSAYRACLELAEQKGVSYLAFPSISTGVYGYPVDQAAPLALGEIVAHLQKPNGHVRRVMLVLFDDRTLQAYSRALREMLPAGE